MSNRIAIYIVSLITLSLVAIYGIVTYKNTLEYNETKTACKIVRDSFWDEKFDEKANGFVYGPDGLRDYLLLTEEKYRALDKGGISIHEKFIYDIWGGKIFVVKFNGSILVKSNGPDLIKNTSDDLEF
jgi:hypothetical protein